MTKKKNSGKDLTEQSLIEAFKEFEKEKRPLFIRPTIAIYREGIRSLKFKPKKKRSK